LDCYWATGLNLFPNCHTELADDLSHDGAGYIFEMAVALAKKWKY
jgi:hypothetical protein